ncbi:MAG: MBL fold metallo-hydrolase [Sciscionella sp.]
MLLTVLGCSGSVPGPNAPTSGYLLEADGFRLVIDLGNGTLAELQSRIDPFAMNALLFSHLHPDHCADFSGLTVIRRYHPDPPHDTRVHRLPVHAPAEAARRLAAAYAPCERDRGTEDLADVYDFRALGHRGVEIGPFTVTALEMAHPCLAYGFRISHGDVMLAYTGDTGTCAAADELASGADVLLSEASWTHAPQARPVDLHLSGREAGELAQRGEVGKLLLTHVPPWTNRDAVFAEARAAYRGDAELVRQGASYDIG